MEKREFVESPELRPMVEQLARRWSIEPLRFVRNFENAVYELTASPRPMYLRLTPVSHRTSHEIASELDFVRFLGESGIPVVQPVAARDGSLLCTAELDGQTFIACVFEEASGFSYQNYTDIDHRSFFFNAGRLMAEVHEAGTRYQPSPDFTRFSWREDRWQRFPELVPTRESEAWNLYEELMVWTSSLATDTGQFGLIHGDFTLANLRIEGDHIMLFDLDSCCAHWRAYEIATFLHFFGARPDLRSLAYHRLLDGYAQVISPNRNLLEQIPMFGKMRLLYSFLVFAAEWGFENLTDEQESYFALRRGLFRGEPLWPSTSTAF